MHSEPLADALGRAELPDSSLALERAVAAARELVEDRRPRRRRALTGGRALALAAVALLAIGFATLTPPGQAAADWVGELLRGDPGGEVLGTGTSPGGATYEVRAQINGGGGCIMFTWISPPVEEEATKGFGSCGEGLDTHGSIQVPFIAETDGDLLLIGAVTNLQPSEVRLEYRESLEGPTIEAPARTFVLDDAALAAIGDPANVPEATFIVGFIPDSVGEVGAPTSAELIALKAEGTELAREPITWVAGGYKGYRTPCGTQSGPWEDVCRAAVDEDFRFQQLMRRLNGIEPPPDLVQHAGEAGIALAPASREDALSLPVEQFPGGIVGQAMEVASKSGAVNGAGGDYELYLARAGDERRLAIAVHLALDECKGGADAVCRPRSPWDREALVLVDAATGDEISATRLESTR